MTDIPKCSFCGKLNSEAMLMIAGPGSVFICDDCVEICRDVLGAHRARQPVPFPNSKTEANEAMQ